VLNVDMSIFDAGGSLIKTWTRVSAPIAGVGGNRYGWFDFNQFSTLAFSELVVAVAVPALNLLANEAREEVRLDGRPSSASQISTARSAADSVR
jgi:hypothetical protein